MPFDNYYNLYRRNKIVEPSQLYDDRDIWTPTSDQKFMLGAEYWTNDGRAFRYCKDGGSGIGKALMSTSFPVDAQGVNIAQTAYGVTAGEKRFDVLLTTSNALSNGDLRDGCFFVNQGGSAKGDMYIIKDNIWQTGDTVMMVEVADSDGCRNAIAATDELTFVKNICRDVKVAPVTHDGIPIGVTQAAITASYYFWAQFRGICCMLSEASETVVAGEPVGLPGTPNTAGACGPLGADTDPIYGICINAAHANQSTPDYVLVNLLLP